MAEVTQDETLRDKLARKWMELIEAKIDDKTINATESAILMRVLLHSGWTLDPRAIPTSLADKLTESLKLDDPATAEELGILPMKRKA